ncbi:MAG: T9SS type A sorting domain-containing protein [bacterium]
MNIRRTVVRGLGAMLTAAFVTCAAGAASAELRVSRFTIDGGGGRSTSGSFALGGTIGQPDAGLLAGSSFTLSGGFWFGGGGVVTAVESDTPGHGADVLTAPLSFRLYAPRPNPVARQTVIAFDLSAPGFVRAALYDVSGRLVRLLADELLPAGKHARAWDRRSSSGQVVPSGIYFLRLDAGAHRSHQKIVVVD